MVTVSDETPPPTTSVLRRALVPGSALVAALVLATWTPPRFAGGAPALACPADGRPLVVAAAPEIAGLLSTATASGPDRLLTDPCLHVRVDTVAPADVMAELRATAGRRPDVWIPDSSTWLDGLALPTQEAVSTAASPVVLAVDRSTAVRSGWPERPLDLVPALQSGAPQPVRLGVPSPHRWAPSRLGLLQLQRVLGAGATGRARVSAALRAAEQDLPTDTAALFDRLADSASLAVPVTEQAVWARGADGARGPVAYYPPGATLLDYPLVRVTRDPARDVEIAQLRSALTGAAWHERVAAAGFRLPGGHPAPGLGTERGVDGSTAAGPAPQQSDVARAVEVFDVLRRGMRMLAVIDVSGSMAESVPGASGATRLDVAVAAATSGLALLADEAEVGLWVFSRDLGPSGDFRQLAPIGPLGRRSDGRTGRQVLAQALSSVAVVPQGDTGLYDTTLAAVRHVREEWDPHRTSSVVLISDGRNDDDGLALEALLERLQVEDEGRPVPVMGIAYGPDSDLTAMQRISQVTGGRTYASPDPHDLAAVLEDALTQRTCRPAC